MKDNLDKESRAALVTYRMERSFGSMKEAELMAQKGFYNAAINRLYYACYYAVVALLLQNDISAYTHNGVKTMLGLHFTSKGKFQYLRARLLQRCLRKDIAVTMMILSIVTRK